MKVLLVHAHPEPQSFCAAMAVAAESELQAMGHEVKVSDLYAMQFNPVASAADFESRKNADYLVYALEQRTAWKNQTLAPDIASEVDKLQWCDALILNFPVFWCGMPAIMKGWIDRVFLSGMCYGGVRIYDQGGLVGKKALVSATIGGREDMFSENGIHGPIQTMLRPVLQGSLAYVGMEVLPPFMAWHVPYVSEEARADMLTEYRQYLRNWHTLTPLVFPRLADFNPDLSVKS